MKIIILAISVLNFLLCLGQSEISRIPDEVRRGADAVYLLNDGDLTITPDYKVLFQATERIAILNPEGQKFAVKNIWYDQLRKIALFKAVAFDQYGNEIQVLKKMDSKISAQLVVLVSMKITGLEAQI